MLRFQAGRLAASLGLVLLVSACGSGARHASRQLGDRLQTQLALDIAAGQATVQPLPAGAQVTLADPATFADGSAQLGNKGRDLLASVIQGLLDPRLLQIDVQDPAAIPDSLQAMRVRNVNQFFIDFGLGSALGPAASSPPSAAAPAAGLTITISINCPRGNGVIGYDSGKSEPVCD